MGAQPGPILKGYVNVPHGQVHFRAAGHGPPVVLLHDSPRSSIMHLPQLDWLADEFTVIALDTPGYGNSTPLPAEPRAEIPDFAAALDATLAALGFERCTVYGFHTSSKMVLELAASHPVRLAGGILDGLSLPPGPPDETFIARYMKPFTVSADGSHLAAQWTKVRDFHRFFPWFAHTAAARLPMDLPDAQHLHTYCMDTLMAGPAWTSAYSAAMRYQALPALPRVGAPLTFTCRADDVLYRYLDALPDPLPAGCALERLSGDPDEWRNRLRGLLAQYARRSAPAAGWTRPDPFARTIPRGETRGYVDLPRGQVHVRVYGAGDRPPLLLLHETPGSSRQLRALARVLATDRLVIVPDLPGTGESSPLPQPDMSAYRDAMLAVLDRFASRQADIHAEFTAGPLALELARSAGSRIRRLSIDGAFMPGRAECRRLWREYCPTLTPRWDGTHLLSAWHRLRDQELNWPWFEHSSKSVRRREPDLDAERLNDQVVDVLKQPDNYGDAALAAFEYRVRDVLHAISQPVLLLHEPGDVRSQWTAGMQRRLPDARIIERSRDPAMQAQAIRAFLDQDQA